MTRPLVFLFAFCCGAIVANLYYAQPIVALIAPEIGLSPHAAGLIVSLTQIGYAFGLFFLVPLGDLVENRRLMMATTLVCMLALAATAFVDSAPAFLALSLLIGLGSAAVQMMIPLAAHLAPEASRGRVVGSVMGGLVLGIMLARPVASLVAESFGWRALFGAAALLMLAIEIVFALTMPVRRPDHRASYGELIGSLFTLARRQPVLRLRMAVNGLMFGGFTLFWTAVPLELVRNHGFTQREVALFALVGATGAIAAPIGGRLADAGLTRIASFAALSCALLAWLPGLATGPGATSVVVLAITGVVIDFCVQGNMVLGQREIYALDPASRSRMTALFMTSVFIGGALGAALATTLFERSGWSGAAMAGAGFPLAALVLYAAFGPRRAAQPLAG